MFITSDGGGYNRDGEQVARGRFLIVGDDSPAMTLQPALFAIVRHVRMRQCGHFMMGSAQVGPDRIVLSGPFGNDDLPIDMRPLSAAAKAKFVRLPADVAEAFWAGAHKTVGAWARDKFK